MQPRPGVRVVDEVFSDREGKGTARHLSGGGTHAEKQECEGGTDRDGRHTTSHGQVLAWRIVVDA